MNPNAKEFVPAHLLKRRQEDGNQLAEKVGQVELEDSGTNKSETESNITGGDQEDRHLLKAGESYCEFNGEQFIVPGEEDEYEPDYQPDYEGKAGYDFGNAEDNEDEDVCNAYEQFLDNLPEKREDASECIENHRLRGSS